MAVAVGAFEWQPTHRGDVAKRPASTSRSDVGCGQVDEPNVCGGGVDDDVGATPGAPPPPPPPPPHPATALAITAKTPTQQLDPRPMVIAPPT
jgi:hypothetical protein